jgi:hypothetical protein
LCPHTPSAVTVVVDCYLLIPPIDRQVLLIDPITTVQDLLVLPPTRKTTMETNLGRHLPRIPWHKILMDHGYVTPEMLAHDYKGAGIEDNPYLVTFLDDDPRDPLQFPPWLRWMLCGAAGYVTFSVAFISSAYTSGIRGISTEFEASPESATLGLSLFLIGFVLGPFAWGPSSGKQTKAFQIVSG